MIMILCEVSIYESYEIQSILCDEVFKLLYIYNFLDRWGNGNYRRRETIFPKTHTRFENLSYSS